MIELRRYGSPPYRVAVVHGGPGAPGEMAPVARELSSARGVLEPLQNAATLDGQVGELHGLLRRNGEPPLTVIGWSWGAWLAFIYAAGFPGMVGKLVLVGSGPFEAGYASGIGETRLGRLEETERKELLSLTGRVKDPAIPGKDALMARIGELISKADSYRPIPHEDEVIAYRYDLYAEVWEQADELRGSSELLELGARIRCPVVAVHGDYDPHPYQGVVEPLSRVLEDFRFILLENCGHHPWFEEEARDRFFEIIEGELS